MASRALLLSSEGLYPQDKRPQGEIINLAMGIFTQAVRDLVSPQKKLERDWKHWQRDSRYWFRSDEFYTGSFLWVCDLIGADADGMRDWVKWLAKQDDKKIRATILSLIRLTYLRNPAAPGGDFRKEGS